MSYSETGKAARASRGNGEVYKTVLRQIGSAPWRTSSAIGKIPRISHYSEKSQAYILRVVVQDGLTLGHIEKVSPCTYQITEEGERYANS